MKKILSLLTIFALTTTSVFAKTFTVIKTSGNRAEVEFPKNTSVKVGEVLAPDPTEAELDLWLENPQQGSRKHKIALSGSSEVSFEDSGAFSNVIAVGFGFNYGSFEFTPSMSYTMDESTSKLGLGVSAEFNFIENEVGAFVVPAFIVSSFAQSGQGTGYHFKSITFSAGFKVKLYPFPRSQTSISFALLFNRDRTFVSLSDSGTTSGGAWTKSLSIPSVGLETYF